MLWLADLLESQPPTGEPSARNWPARFGGRGDLIRRPYPYLNATRSRGSVTLSYVTPVTRECDPATRAALCSGLCFYAFAPAKGFSVRKSAFSPSTARKMARPMPIGNNQSRAGIGAEWNHTFKNGT